MTDLRDELQDLYFKLGMIQADVCDQEETVQFRKLIKHKGPLPEDVYQSEGGIFYRFVQTDMTQEEIEHLFLCRQVSYLKSIKSSMTFFVVLAVIGLILGLLSLLSVLILV